MENNIEAQYLITKTEKHGFLYRFMNGLGMGCLAGGFNVLIIAIVVGMFYGLYYLCSKI